jgi:phospholipid/cholesterol/gamma-HCH transport system substrate-binding protein
MICQVPGVSRGTVVDTRWRRQLSVLANATIYGYPDTYDTGVKRRTAICLIATYTVTRGRCAVKFDANTMAKVMFVAVLLISTVVGAIWYLRSVSQYATYQIRTDDPVSGLAIDAPIEFHGVDVGKVKAIRLVSPRSVSIVLSIDKSAPVTSASVATITSRGLATRGYTGYVYISLDDVGVDSRPLTTPPGESYPVIRTAPSKIITLDTSINQVKDNVQIITDLLQSLLDKKTILSLQQSVDSLRQFTKVLAANDAKLKSILTNTERASRRFEPLLMSADDTVSELRTQIVPELHEAMTNLEPLLQSSHDTVSALQMQILPEARNALINLDNLSTTLTGVAGKFNQNPSILIRGTTPPPPGPGETP